MKKILMWGFLSILVLAFSIPALAAEKVITIRYTDQHPPKHFLAQLATRFADTVNKRSGGRLKVVVYLSGQLYQDREVIDAVRTNSVEIGNVNIGQWGGIYPLLNLIDYMPFEVDDALGYKLIDGKIGEVFREQMKKAGVMPLMWVPTALMDGVTNNKRELRVPDDFKGLLIRAPHPAGEYRLKAFGASPVVIPASDMFTALQYGTVDGCWTALASVQSRKLYEIQKYLTVFSLGPNFHPTIMNLKSFQGLPKDLQEIVLQSAMEIQRWGRQAVDREENDSLEKLKKEMKTFVLAGNNAKPFAEKLKSITEEYIKIAAPEGEKLVQTVYQIKREGAK